MTIRIKNRPIIDICCIKIGEESVLTYSSSEEIRRFLIYCNAQRDFKNLTLLHDTRLWLYPYTIQELIEKRLYNLQYVIPYDCLPGFIQAVNGFNHQQASASI